MASRNSDQYSEEETAKRRDEVIRRMANTPPQHRVSRSPQKQKSAGEGRAPQTRGDHAKPENGRN
jgi:hypothetical protein